MKYLLDCGSRLVPGRYETERTYYAALTPSIVKLLKEHKANPNQIHHLSVNLLAMKDAALFADVEIQVVEGGKIHSFLAHRFVLSERSPYFRALLDGSSSSKTVDGRFIKLSFEAGPDQLFANAKIAKIILTFLYSAVIDVHETDAPFLMYTLSQLGFDSLNAPIQKQLDDEDRELRDLVIKLDSQRSILTTDLSRAYRQISSNSEGVLALEELSPHHDVLLKLTDENIAFACHRAILLQHSAYFHALMTSPFAEGNQVQSSHGSIAELEIMSFKSPQLFEHIMAFLYTNQISEALSEVDTIDLLVLADVLLIMELKRLLAAKVRKFIKLQTVWDIFEMSVARNISSLKSACLDFIDDHSNTLRNTEKFQYWLNNGPADVITELHVCLEKAAERREEM